MPIAPTPPTHVAVAAAASARRERAIWLTALAQKEIAVGEFFSHSVTISGRPLLSIRLGRLIEAMTGLGEQTSRMKATSVAKACGASTKKPAGLTVRWLMANPKERLTALLQVAETGGRKPAWQGYPFSPAGSSRSHP